MPIDYSQFLDSAQPAASAGNSTMSPASPAPMQQNDQAAPFNYQDWKSKELSGPKSIYPTQADQNGAGWDSKGISDFADEQKAGLEEADKNSRDPLGNIYRFGADALSGLSNVAQGSWKLAGDALSVANPSDTRSIQDKGLSAVEDANQTVGGAFQAIGSPLNLYPIAKKVVSTPFEAINHSITALVKGTGMDPNSRESKDFIATLNNVAGLGAAALGGAEGESATPAEVKTKIADTWNQYIDAGHDKIQQALTPEMANKLVNVSDAEKTLKTQAMQKVMNDKVDLTQWNSTVDAQVGKLKGMIDHVQQYGRISVGDLHNIVNEFQRIKPAELSNPYVPEVNGNIGSYLINSADKQTGGFLSQMYDQLSQKPMAGAPPTAPEAGQPSNPQMSAEQPAGQDAQIPQGEQAPPAPESGGQQTALPDQGNAELDPAQINLERQARKAGATESEINTVRNLTPEQKTNIAQPYYEHGVARAQDMIKNNKSIWSLPGDEIDAFRDKANAKRQEIGKAEGKAINTDLKGKTVNASPIVKAFKGVLDDMNVSINEDGKLDTEGSDIELNSDAKKAVNSVLKSLNKNKILNDQGAADAGTTLDARGLVSINRMINDAVKKAEKAGLGGNQLSVQLSPIKDAIEEVVKPISPDYAKYKAQYASIAGDLGDIETAGKFGSKKNKGFNGQQILKRSLNDNNASYLKAFDAMANIEKNHGITAPKDLPTKAYVANLMERLTDTQSPRQFGKQLRENIGNNVSKGVISKVAGEVPVVGGLLSHGVDAVHEGLVDANYKYAEGKLPGLKDAAAKAKTAHVEAFRNLIGTPEFVKLPTEVKTGILQKVASSIPANILAKVAKLSFIQPVQNQNNDDE